MAIQHQAARLDENFPVASWLIPPQARTDILALYDFARGADNIADDGSLPASERYAALQALREALDKYHKNRLPPWAVPYFERVERGFLPASYGDRLLQAFMLDTQKHRYANLRELLDYCDLSAAPVGQAVLVLCGEKEADLAASDALCHVLQLLNHLQDIQSDYVDRGRIYLPVDWMAIHGVAETDLKAASSSEGLRQVIDQVLDVCDAQLVMARALLPTIRARRLRWEVATIHAIAVKLATKLRAQDPLAMRVSLSKTDKLICLWRGWRLC